MSKFDALYTHYLPVVESLVKMNGYSKNVSHLLKILVPLFALKYEVSNDPMLMDVFQNVLIVFDDSFQDSDVKALYLVRPVRQGSEVGLVRHIVINGQKDNLLYLSFLESMVHEYLHAFNSYRNSYKTEDRYLFLRTGLSYSAFDKNTLKFVEHDTYLLFEEVLNTIESERLINLLLEQESNIADVSLVLSSLKQEVDGSFQARGYRLPILLVEKLVRNSLFYHQALHFRINGEVDDFTLWFDNVTGTVDSFKELSNLLTEVVEMISKLEKTAFLLRGRLNRNIKKKVVSLNQIIDIYLDHSIG